MGDRRRLLHVESLVYDLPHAVSRARMEAIDAVLQAREDDGGIAAALAAVAEPMRAECDHETVISADGVATLPVMGTYVKRAGGIDALSGIYSYQSLIGQLDALGDNATVRGVILRGDTPGGTVAGMFEAEAAVKRLAAKMPVWAIADEQACSAGYLILSAATYFFVPSTGIAGSVGTRGARRVAGTSASGAHTIFLASGEQKLDGNPETPPTDAEIARLQAKLDQMGDLLRAAVAKNRGMTVEAVAALQAGVFIGTEAVRVGLADDAAKVLGPYLGEDFKSQTVTYAEAHAAFTAFVKSGARTTTFGRTAATTSATTGATPPQRRPAMGDRDNVAAITDHPDYKKTTDGIRAEVEAEWKEYCDDVTTLCTLAGQPAMAATFITEKKPIADVRTWSLAESAKKKETGVSGLEPAGKGAGENDLIAQAVKAAPKMTGREDILARRANIMQGRGQTRQDAAEKLLAKLAG